MIRIGLFEVFSGVSASVKEAAIDWYNKNVDKFEYADYAQGDDGGSYAVDCYDREAAIAAAFVAGVRYAGGE